MNLLSLIKKNSIHFESTMYRINKYYLSQFTCIQYNLWYNLFLHFQIVKCEQCKKLLFFHLTNCVWHSTTNYQMTQMSANIDCIITVRFRIENHKIPIKRMLHGSFSTIFLALGEPLGEIYTEHSHLHIINNNNNRQISFCLAFARYHMLAIFCCCYKFESSSHVNFHIHWNSVNNNKKNQNPTNVNKCEIAHSIFDGGNLELIWSKDLIVNIRYSDDSFFYSMSIIIHHNNTDMSVDCW